MAISPLTVDPIARRMALVDEHVRCENAHDLDGVIATFGAGARYDDEPWAEHHEGLDGVRHFYSSLMGAVPDLTIEILKRYVSADNIILEVVIRGTHLGAWRGLPATGRKLAIPLCGIYTFDADDRLAGERIYYDRATVLRQLGVFHEPQTFIGDATTFLTHPWTIAKALARKLGGK
ncbi:protein of unknown function DUF1486 [Candidatus Koribacter versatilis Ellin345]|uniref:Ester cyclase n=1 Tax=Koribacter versatilis (strain Ellin345) TaxID=204669 RepID=Q1INA8_KORVE|nr:ester cyclase [Candidatus Koribacter versatilis]ABF41642.1 protein of unknown function DUF1486 [Candidatus Koribacter versatilis Ellin345]